LCYAAGDAMRTIIRGGDATEIGECGTCDAEVCTEEQCRAAFMDPEGLAVIAEIERSKRLSDWMYTPEPVNHGPCETLPMSIA
jgi:hypothetical protein